MLGPGPIHAKWAQKANWGDPVIRAKLAVPMLWPEMTTIRRGSSA